MLKDNIAPRGQPQKMSMEAHFLAERTADLVARLVPCKLLPEKQKIPFFSLVSWLIFTEVCIVRNYNRNYRYFRGGFGSFRVVFCSKSEKNNAFYTVFFPTFI